MLKRMRRGTVVAAGIVGLLTAVSMAFFVGSFLADGSHEGTAGTGGSGTNTLPISVNFPSAALTPQTPVEVTAEIENTAAKAVTFTKITPTITTAEPSKCLPQWFHLAVEGGGKSTQWMEAFEGKAAAPVVLKYEPGAKVPLLRSTEAHIKLVLEETGTNQEACEGLGVKVAFHLS